MPRRETKTYPIAGLKAIDTETGQFEAIVSVFGNVDLHGHRIAVDAFDASLERWRANGDPIPVIFSHQWDDLSAYLGTVDPANAKALPPGDPDLPEAVREFGGLYVAGQFDTTEPEGRKAAKLLKSRAVKEFSFAYDVLDEAKADDGFLDLLELDLIEVGPTLKGANPLTQLVAAKAAAADFDQAYAKVAEAFDMKASDVAELLAAVETLTAAADEPAPAATGRSKAFVTLAGTLERLQEALRVAAQAWAVDTYADNLYAVELEGTFTDRVVFYVELWDDPVGGGRYFEAEYSAEGDAVTFGEPAPVAIEASTVPKSRRGVKVGARNATADLARIQGIHDLTRELGAACEDPDGTAGDAPDESDDEGEGTESRPKSSKPSVLLATIDAELLEI